MKKKIIIIGSGITGLSAGIYSAMNGFDTEIIEMHNVAGGQCTAWERKKYRFDYCLHWLVGTSKGAFHEIWKETNDFLMAGQWLFPVGGLPPSAQTGKWSVQLICKKEKQKFITDK